MTSRSTRPFAMLVAAVALAACHRGATASSPAPGPSAGTGAAAAAKVGLPAGVTQAMADSGKVLFTGSSCARCHGASGSGAPNGPNLTDATWVQIDGSYDAIVKIIHDGVPKDKIKGSFQFNMRPMGGGTFSDAQVRMIAAYVYNLGHK